MSYGLSNDLSGLKNRLENNKLYTISSSLFYFSRQREQQAQIYTHTFSIFT